MIVEFDRAARQQRGRIAFSAKSALALLTLCAPAWAAGGPDVDVAAVPATEEIAQQGARVRFDIPPQPLAAAIAAFIRATGWQVGYATEIAQGVQSPGLAATETPEEALKRLLAGTGIVYRITGANTVTLEKPAASGAITLDPVTVEGKAVPRQAEIGNLPPVYPGGQVARGGKLGLLGNRDVMDTPFNQTSYTSKLIQEQQAATIGDVVANDPSVRRNFARTSNIDEFTIRGFNFFNREITFNGLYGILPSSAIPVELAERVEVLKGPNALLNGMAPGGSIGGGVNVVAKRAGDEPLTQLTAMYASDLQPGTHIDVGRRFGADKSFGIRVNGVYRNGDTPVDNNSQELALATLGFDFRGERFRVDADLGRHIRNTEGQQSLLFPGTVVPALKAPDSRTNFFQPWTYSDNKDLFGAVRGEFDLTSNLTVFAALGASDGTIDSLQTNWTVQDSSGRIRSLPFYSNSYSEARTGELGIRGKFATGAIDHAVSVSASAYDQEDGQASSSQAAIFSNIYNPAAVAKPALPSFGNVPKISETDLSSVALADTISLFGERVQLTVGIRRQKVGAKSFNASGATTSQYSETAITPAVGLIVKPWQNVSLYGNYIEGLIQGPTAPTTAANAGEVFPPFHAKQYEAGAKIDHGAFATTLSAFQITLPSSFTDPSSNVFKVDGEQRNRGLEINTFGEVVQGVRLLGGAMYLDAVQAKTAGGTNDGKAAIAAPQVQANLGAEWDTPFWKGLTFSVRAIYTASQQVNAANTVEIPDWVRFDVGARYRLETGYRPIVVRAAIENLLGNDYWASAGRGRLLQGAPRTFLLSTTIDF